MPVKFIAIMWYFIVVGYFFKMPFLFVESPSSRTKQAHGSTKYFNNVEDQGFESPLDCEA